VAGPAGAAFDVLVQRARDLGRLVGQAAVESGDYDRTLEDDELDELRASLWSGGTSDGQRVLRREIGALGDAERASLPPADALWDRLYDAWTEAYEERVRELVAR
jgi:hypothetical protein